MNDKGKIVRFDKGSNPNGEDSNSRERHRIDYKKMAMVLFFSLMIIWSISSFVVSQIKMAEIKAAGKEYGRQMEGLKAEVEELKKEKSQSQSVEYVEKVAREKLKMVKPNEVIYFIKGISEKKIKDSNTSNTP